MYVGSSLAGPNTGPTDATGLLTAFDHRTGEVIWEAQLPNPALQPPVVTEDGILVTSSDEWVFCD